MTTAIASTSLLGYLPATTSSTPKKNKIERAKIAAASASSSFPEDLREQCLISPTPTDYNRTPFRAQECEQSGTVHHPIWGYSRAR